MISSRDAEILRNDNNDNDNDFYLHSCSQNADECRTEPYERKASY